MKFEYPEINVTKFDIEDVITTSDPIETQENETPKG